MMMSLPSPLLLLLRIRGLAEDVRHDVRHDDLNASVLFSKNVVSSCALLPPILLLLLLLIIIIIIIIMEDSLYSSYLELRKTFWLFVSIFSIEKEALGFCLSIV